jgi:hypothetical protein
MNMSTVNSTTFSLTDSGTNVIGDADNATQLVWAADNMSFTFSPGELEGMETYTIWISTDVMTAMDMAILHRDWMSEFTTEETVPPSGWIDGYVTEMIYGVAVPVEGAMVKTGTYEAMTDVDGMYSLQAAAGTGMDVTASKFLYDSATETGIDVVVDEHTIDVNFTLTPIINIDVSVMVGGTSTDVDPESDALEMVDVDTMIVMTYDEALNGSTIEEFTLDSVTGDTVWNADNMTVTFTPAANLSDSTEYTLTITTAVTNETDMQILPRDVEGVQNL